MFKAVVQGQGGLVVQGRGGLVGNGAMLFKAAHVVHVDPVLLGPATWGVMSEQRLGYWSDFKSAVEAQYGLSRRSCLRAFYDMTPEADKATGDFLRRVEDM